MKNMKSFSQWLHNQLPENDPILVSATTLQIIEHLTYGEVNEFNIRKAQIEEFMPEKEVGRLEDLWRKYREEYVTRSIEDAYFPED